MERKQITAEMVAKLNEPLPAEAVRPHPSKSFLSTINSIYVTERLNDVFGVGSWQVRSEIVENQNKMVVTKTIFEIPDYGIKYECFGGNDNADKGDAYKGAVTDAITKIGSWLGIGAHVWKDKKTQGGQPAPKQQPKPQTQPQPQAAKNVATRRERVTQFLKGLDDITFNTYCDYFKIEDVNLMTDDQVNAVANYLNSQNKK
jgi:hypothetical protein